MSPNAAADPSAAGIRAETFAGRLERLLAVAVSAPDEPTLEEASRRVSAAGRQVAEDLALLALELRDAASPAERLAIVGRIRRLVGA